jgi:putative endopeptidase
MKRLLSAFAATTILAGCAATPEPIVTAPAPEVAVVPVASPAPAAPRPELGSFGFDAAGMNRSVEPGHDWVEFANGNYLRTLEIPADRSSFGAFNVLDELSRTRTRGIIEEAAKQNAAEGTNAQKVGDFYKSFMDEAAIEARGAAPLAATLQPFLAASSMKDL